MVSAHSRSSTRNLHVKALSAGFFLLLAGSASAQEFATQGVALQSAAPEASDAQIGHLDRWLLYANDEGRRNRFFNGSLAVVGSGLLVAFGTVALLDDSPRTEFSKGFGFVAAVAGGATLVMGVTLLAIPSPSEKRYARWTETTGRGMTEDELARFEGELRYSLKVRANTKTRQRRWGSLGLVVGGGLLIGLTAAADLSTLARRLGFGAGGTLTAIGAIGFGLSFIPPRDLWERYEAGLPPADGQVTKASLQVTPIFTHQAGGLSLSGRF